MPNWTELAENYTGKVNFGIVDWYEIVMCDFATTFLIVIKIQT